jgi:hypothetical protein
MMVEYGRPENTKRRLTEGVRPSMPDAVVVGIQPDFTPL